MLLDKPAILAHVVNKLKKVPEGRELLLETYKRDRSVTVIKKGDDDFLIVEDGYCQARYEVTGQKVKKILKTLLKREFPRSNKVRLTER